MKAVAEEALGDYEAAYEHCYCAVHFQQYLSRGYQCLARLDLRRGDFHKACVHSGKAIAANALNPQLWALKATAMRLEGESGKAAAAAERALALDPINPYALNELLLAREDRSKSGGEVEGELEQVLLDDPHYYLELALNYLNVGLYEEAAGVLERIEGDEQARNALTGYYYAYCRSKSGRSDEAGRLFEESGRRPVEYSFPFRREALDVFRTALETNPGDGRAHYFLGLVYGGIGEVDSAITHWQLAVRNEPENVRAWRNLGLANFHVRRDLAAARRCYEKAFELLPTDSRILLELDEVKQAQKESAAERLTFLREHQEVVEGRDDLLTSMLDLKVRQGDFVEALEYYISHHFHNWEGGYSIHNAYMEANVGMALKTGTPEKALECYQRACEYPANLEVAPREPNLRGFLYYPMAQLRKQLGDEDEAVRLLGITAEETTENPTLSSYYQALALRELGQSGKAENILSQLRSEGQRLVDGSLEGYEREDKVFMKALGYYYLSKAYEAYGQRMDAQDALNRAAALSPMIEREALVFAQIAYARAHQ